MLLRMTAVAGTKQLDHHQDERQRIEKDMPVKKIRAEAAAVQETFVKCDPPGRMILVQVTPNRALIVRACGERGGA